MDPKIKAIKEGELAALKRQQEDEHRKDREKKLAKRYHHVRFFERVKIDRSIGKLEKKARAHADGDGPALTSEEQSRLEQLKEDLEASATRPGMMQNLLAVAALTHQQHRMQSLCAHHRRCIASSCST